MISDLRATPGFKLYIPPIAGRGIVTYCFLAVAPQGATFANRLYVVYTDFKTVGSQTGIYCRYSDNGGVTWSAESFLSNDSRVSYAFHPNVAVSNDGTVGVAFYVTGGAASHKTKYATVFSHDGGATWTPVTVVADGVSDETVSGTDQGNQYGDYQGIAASPDGTFHYVWCDSRPQNGTNKEEMFTARQAPVAPVTKGLSRWAQPTDVGSRFPAYAVAVAREGGDMGSALLNFSIPEGTPASLWIVDAGGRTVRTLIDGYTVNGDFSVRFNGRDSRERPLPGGVYFYRLVAGSHSDRGKIVISH